ncbi:MAG: hypothetical protein J1E83_07590 [Lachnospiraceae bacterium]|nr:hypothetical protein [Lachnospiraceae bacterium]
MKEKAQRTARIVGLFIAMVLLVNTFYVPEVSAIEPYTIMTIYPELTTADGRVTVKLCITYQESTGIFTGASIQQIIRTTDVSQLTVGNAVLSSDKKKVTVEVAYNFPYDGTTYRRVETLSKSVP